MSWPVPDASEHPGRLLEHAAAPGTLPEEGGIWAETRLPASVPAGTPPFLPSPTEHLWPLLPFLWLFLMRVPSHSQVTQPCLLTLQVGSQAPRREAGPRLSLGILILG